MHGTFLHFGDWMTHTAYCDWMVKAAYLELLTAYYTSEMPFPDDFAAIFRAIGATTRAEKEATERALHHFFKLAPDGLWHQKRADEEIERAKDFSETQRNNANSGWKKRNKGNAALSRQHGVSVDVANLLKSGVVEPHRSSIETMTLRTPANGYERISDANGNASAYATVMPTVSHKNTNTLLAAASSAHAGCVRACEAAAAAGIEINPNDPRIAALVADGATPAEFRLAAARATAAGKGVAWFVAAVSGMRRDASGAGSGQEGAKTGLGSPNYPMLPRWDDPH